MSSTSSISAVGKFSADEIRRIVAKGKETGLIRAGDQAAPVAKNGSDIATTGALRSQWIEITPDRAAKWLENNFRNRPVKEDVVHAYARDMLAGVWVATHQGIAFNDRDELIDGQHRLMAIVAANITVRMMVTFGLPSKIDGKEMTTMDCVDRGRTRSVADQLKIQHGMKDGSIIAAVSASLAALCSSERTRRLSVGQTLEIYDEFRFAVDAVIAQRSKAWGLRSAGVLAAFAFAMTSAKDSCAKITAMYCELVGAGEELRERTAMHCLRAFLTSEEAKLLTRGTDRGMAELVLEAIRLELAKKPVTKLELSTAGAEFFRNRQPERVAKIAAMFALPGRS